MACVSVKRTLLTRSAVLHADIALGTHMEPCFKAILEGYGGDIEVITQAFKAEILLFFHGVNLVLLLLKCKGENAIDLRAIVPCETDRLHSASNASSSIRGSICKVELLNEKESPRCLAYPPCQEQVPLPREYESEPSSHKVMPDLRNGTPLSNS